jgi:hypothetical protein
MPGNIPGWNVTYSDNFTSSATLANYQVYSSWPGSNSGDGSNSCWATSHAVVSGGELVLRGYKDPAAIKAYNCTATTNQIVTAGVKLLTDPQTYGKYEVRMRADNGEGVSIVALLWPDPDAWPPEIDFVEDNGTSPRTFIQATDFDPSGAATRNTLSVNVSQWHTYGVEWSPGKLVYTIDGTDWATVNDPNVSAQPMDLTLQTEAWQANNGWEVTANRTTPAEVDMDVDWLVVYEAS